MASERGKDFRLRIQCLCPMCHDVYYLTQPLDFVQATLISSIYGKLATIEADTRQLRQLYQERMSCSAVVRPLVAPYLKLVSIAVRGEAKP